MIRRILLFCLLLAPALSTLATLAPDLAPPLHPSLRSAAGELAGATMAPQSASIACNYDSADLPDSSAHAPAASYIYDSLLFPSETARGPPAPCTYDCDWPFCIAPESGVLFRGTTEGYAGRYGISPTSTDPAVAAHYAANAATQHGGKGVVHVIPRNNVAGKVLPPQRNALPHDLEVPLDIPASGIPGVSSKTLSVDDARALLQRSVGENVPARIYDQGALDALLQGRTPLTDDQIRAFLQAIK